VRISPVKNSRLHQQTIFFRNRRVETRDVETVKVGSLKTEHDDELRQLNTRNAANQEAYEDLQSRCNKGAS